MRNDIQDMMNMKNERKERNEEEVKLFVKRIRKASQDEVFSETELKYFEEQYRAGENEEDVISEVFSDIKEKVMDELIDVVESKSEQSFFRSYMRDIVDFLAKDELTAGEFEEYQNLIFQFYKEDFPVNWEVDFLGAVKFYKDNIQDLYKWVENYDCPLVEL